jgi:chloramphenicol-sensitive protein RarD
MPAVTGTDRRGPLYGFLSYTIWGLAPIYFKFIEHIPATEILSHRIIWTIAIIFFITLIGKRWAHVWAILRQPKKMAWLLASSFFIAGNWYIYIQSVNSHQVLATSLGYYICPLTIIIFAVIFLRERLSVWQIVAVSLAAMGVLVQIIASGTFPWTALLIATSFAFFSLIRKIIKVDSLTALLVETLLLCPFAWYFLFSIDSQTGTLHANPWDLNLLLMVSGLMTLLPLFFYAEAANRMSLTTLGFMQYIAPTIMWLLAVFAFQEPLNATTLLSFGFIWAGLICYSIESAIKIKS